MPKPAAPRSARPKTAATTVPTRCSRTTAVTVELLTAGAAGTDAALAADALPEPDTGGAWGSAIAGAPEAAALRAEPLSRCRRFRSLRMSEACW